MPSLRVPFVIRFCWTVAAAGAAVFAMAVAREGVEACFQLSFAVLFAGVVLGELFPIKLPMRGGDEETNLSTVFAFALLVHSGLAAALVAQGIASAVQDVVARKPAWRSAFNVGQYMLCLATADAVLHVFGWRAGPEVRLSGLEVIASALLAGGAFFVVNFLVVGTAVTSYRRVPLLMHLRNDLRTATLMAGVSISLSPLVLAALDRSWLLVGLFLLPFVSVHRSGRLASDSAHQAMHDALTGLPNRAWFQRIVDDAIKGSDGRRRFIVMLLDLDRFKEINDTLGHHYGDRVLQLVASRLPAALRTDDVVARLGGDEFAVLVHADAPDGIVERLVDELSPAVEVDGFLLELDASIGTARYPDDGTDLETLLRRADVAMYEAKSKHLGHVAYRSAIDQYHPTRLALVADLRRGLEADELVLHYQPKLDLRTRTIASVEALVRWEHPRLGLLQPGAFVEMAEHTGLIKPLTHYVLCEAVRQCAAWRDAGRELQVAVNVSPRTLLDRQLPEAVAAALRSSGVDASLLKLEITETAIMVDPVAALGVLGVLAGMGVALSIDDFGTGYSSLAYLRQLPVSEVKIDRSFVHGMATEEGDGVIVRSTIELARNLNLAVVAEGVEDAASLEELARLGCDAAQGYYLSRPLPAAGIAPWLDAFVADGGADPPAPARVLTAAA